MKLGTWTIRSLCSAGSLTTIARKTAKCESDVVGVQEMRWDRGDTEPADDIVIWKWEHKTTCTDFHTKENLISG
jgi:hypothetical protein